MNLISSQKVMLMLMIVALSATSIAGGNNDVFYAQNGKGGWHFRIGPVMAPRVRVKIAGPRQFARPPTVSKPISSGENEVAASPSAGNTDREYVDGYVKPDRGTADSGTIQSGLTWDWGADDLRSQYSNGKMEFRTEMARWEESLALETFGAGSGRDSDRDILLGVEAMGGWTFFENAMFDASVDAGFRFYGSGDLKAKSKYGTTVTVLRNEYRYVDSYDASGWTDSPKGSHVGTEDGPDRLIGATPSRREELMGTTSTSETYYQRTNTRFNYRIWDMRLGPTVGWKVTDYFTIRGGLYGLLGLVDAKLRTSIDSPDKSYGAKRSKCEPIFGMAAGVSAQFDITEHLFLLGATEYDWWTDSVSLRAGGANAHLELSDFTVSLSLGYGF